MVRPKISSVPEVGKIKAFICFAKVDFPEPVCPTRAINSFFSVISRFISLIAVYNPWAKEEYP
jgi:hypothetical protein